MERVKKAIEEESSDEEEEDQNQIIPSSQDSSFDNTERESDLNHPTLNEVTFFFLIVQLKN